MGNNKLPGKILKTKILLKRTKEKTRPIPTPVPELKKK